MGVRARSRAAVIFVVVTVTGIAAVSRAPVTGSVQFQSIAATTGRLAAGEAHTCGIDADGAVWCWGRNSNGQLGDPTFANPSSSTPRRAQALPDGRIAETVAAGDNHTCVLADDDTVWCWGDNGVGQLGRDAAGTSTPQQVSTFTAFSLGAGGNTTCARLTDGTARCWGANSYGQWGNGTSSMTAQRGVFGQTSSVKANPGAGEFALASVDIGFSHVCATAVDGGAWCWGSDDNGQLGSSASGLALVPRGTAPLGAAAEQISAGLNHTCAVLAGGSVSCFGANTSGEIGSDPLSVTSTNVPTTVTGLSGVTRVSAGSWFTCAVAGGQVRCFGTGGDGQRGDGANPTTDHVPSTVTAITETVVDVAAAAEHACAVDASGGVWCWGRNTVGQLGRGATSTRSGIAQKIAGLTVGTTTTTTTTTTSTTTTTTTVPVVTAVTSPPTTSSATSSTTTNAPSTTVTVASSSKTAAATMARVLSLRRTKSLGAARIAAAAGLAIPRKSQGAMRISITTGRTVCRFVGSSVRGVRRGRCTLRVVLVPKKGRTVSRTVTVTVT